MAESWRDIIAELVTNPRWVETTSRRVLEAIRSDMPEVAASADLLEATRDSVEANLRLFGAAARRGLDATQLEPPREAVEWGRIAVRHNIGLASVLRPYRIGHEVAFRLWAETLHQRLSDPALVAQALEEASGLMFTFVDTLSARVAELYTDERERWARSAEALRLETVRRLLGDDQPIDPDTAAGRLRYPLHRHHVAFVLWQEAPEDREAALPELERVAAEAVRPLGLAPMLVATTGRAVLAGWLASTGDVRDLHERPVDASALPPGVRIAFGTPRRGVEGFRLSHRQAVEARRVVQLHPRPQPVSHYGMLALRALATADLGHARTFVEDELGPLAADDDATQRLAATLRVYLEEHASPARTAARLGVHPNTVANRVRAAEELLGRPAGARVAETLVALQLAALVTPPD